MRSLIIAGASASFSTLGNGCRSRPSSVTTAYPASAARRPIARSKVLLPIPPAPETYSEPDGVAGEERIEPRQLTRPPNEQFPIAPIDAIPEGRHWP